MKKTALEYIALLLILAAPAFGAGQGDISTLLHQLSADSWSTRQSAQQHLVAMGQSALPSLQSALKQPLDPETHGRIVSAIDQIHSNQAIGPSVITLDYDSTDIRKVLKDLSFQANAEITLQQFGNRQAAAPTVTIHVHQQPFWIALKALCDNTGLRPQIDWRKGGFELVSAGQNQLDGMTDCTGSYMVVARQVGDEAQVALGQPNQVRRTLSVELTVLAEPKLVLLGHSNLPQVDEAVDEHGQSLISNQRYYGGFNVQDNSIWSARINLQRPDSTDTKIARLRGSIQASIQTRSQAWIVPDILHAKNLSRDFGNCTFTIDSVTHDHNVYVVRVSGARVAASQDDAGLGIGRLEIYDAKGKKMTKHGFGGGGNPQHMNYTFQFDPSDPANRTGAPAKLVWQVPVESKMVDIPFDFRNIPIP